MSFLNRTLRLLIIGLITSLSAVNMQALPTHKFSHYSADDGLDVFVAQNMLQDLYGMLWLGTWDGLYSFDGNTFKRAGSSVGVDNIDNPRINQLAQHVDGTIWMITYDGLVYRFSSISGQYTKITNTEHHVSTMTMSPDGICWLTTDQQILLMAQPLGGTEDSVHVTDLFQSQELRRPSRINDIKYDEKGQHWIMTEEGAYCFSPKDRQLSLVVQASAYEVVFYDDYAYFGGRGGALYRCNLASLQYDEIKLDTNSSIKKVQQMPDGRLLLLAGSDGFYLYNSNGGHYEHLTTANLPALGDNVVRDAFVDRQCELWLRTNQPGIVHYIPATGHCRRHILHDEIGQPLTEASTEQTVIEDVNNRLWVHPSGGGLAYYNRETDELELFYNPQLSHRWNNTSPMLLLFSDLQGNLWFCTRANGLEKASFLQYPFILESADPQHVGRACNSVRAICQMSDGNIWAGCRDRIIRVFSSDYKFVGNLCKDGTLHADRSDVFGQGYCLLEQPDGTIWIGCKGDGLFMLKPRGNGSYAIRQFKASSQDVYSLGSNAVYDLYMDSHQRLWIATFENGVSIMEHDEATDSYRFINTHNELSSYPLISCSRARCITGDGKGNIYIGTTGGLLTCNEGAATASSLRFTRYSFQNNAAGTLSSSDIMSVLISRQGRNFVATFGGGLCEFVRDADGALKFTHFDDPRISPLGDIIYSVIDDNNGSLWITDEDAVSRLDLESGALERYLERLLPMRIAFNEGRPARLRSGEFMVPSLQGALRFNPDSIYHSSFVPNICIRNDSILIPPGQHEVQIAYSALDYICPEVIQYAYRLVGFETEWHYVGNQHIANYTNLPPGKYMFEVQSTNHSGIWVDNVRQLAVELQPTFFETTFARFLLVLLILLIVAGIVTTFIIMSRMHQKIRVEEQVSDMKLKFYANLSHELRTPLTLIIGPLEQIRQRTDLPNGLSSQLDILSSNAANMLRTVNQLLDFRKIEKGKMRLVVQPVDLVAFTEQRVRNFVLLSESMHIPLTFDTKLSRLDIWADTEKLEQIINNLLGNAFKYSKAGQPINVTVSEVDGMAQFIIQDHGVGIALDRLSSIFERFNSPSAQTPSGMASSGIGLSLTKELVLLHSGKIHLDSQLGEGTTFTVTLPLGRDHFNAETEFVSNDLNKPADTSVGSEEAEVQQKLDAIAGVPDALTNETESVTLPVVGGTDSATESIETLDSKEDFSTTILIVEDNTELRQFICQIFESRYRVLEASDGREGLRIVQQQVPDIVISDVMMPLMDGIQMVQQIRQQPQICHIPVVLLTALTDTENKLKGLEAGIDSYITKPFSAEYLLARVENIIRKRLLLQQFFQQQMSSSVKVAAAPNSQISSEQLVHPPLSADQRFVTKVIEDMKANLGNPDYSVDDMAAAASMSRSTYGRKFRALMGIVPTDMLRDLRLQRAGELIDTTDLNISQVAYEVGFSDPHYFGKCFKAYYQMTPSEYKQRQ